ncbi:hypothetical protein QJQ45_027820 [Haematococcus lacustris]|nr:hypothetical protein QJQ45_027820 [Haematococcus lacustris]
MAPALLDKTKQEQTTLEVLQRSDPAVEQVLGNAAHVCLYVMRVENQTWERKNVEGSLFLLKRRTNPRFQIVVLNKLSTENYTEAVHGGFEVELSEPYLMYTQGDGKVHGIWFYDEKDMASIAGLLNRVKAGLPSPDVLPSNLQADTSAAAGRSEDDRGFWDRQAPAQPPQQAQAQGAPQATQGPQTGRTASSQPPQPAAPAPSATALQPAGGADDSDSHTLTALLNRAQLGSRQPSSTAPVPPALMGPSGPAAAPARPGGGRPTAPVSSSAAPPLPLPPSYFQQSAQQPPLPAPVSTAGKHSVTSLEELQRGLADAAGLQQQGMELRPPPLPQHPPQLLQPPSAPQQDPQSSAALRAANGALTALLAGADKRSSSYIADGQGFTPRAAPTTQPPPASLPPHPYATMGPYGPGLSSMQLVEAGGARAREALQQQQPSIRQGAPTPQQQQALLRLALGQLVQRPAFLDMMAEELRVVGLL